MIQKETVVIANGATTSGAVNIGGRSLVLIVFPTMTGASATLSVSPDGTNYQTLGDKAAAVTITTPSTRNVAMEGYLTWGVKYLKVVSAGAEGAERTIDLYLMDVLA